MQMIIEARLVDDLRTTEPIRLAVIVRELTTSPLGLSLAEGKALLASAQQYLVRAQCAGIIAVGVDLAKNVFAVHGVDGAGTVQLRQPKIARGWNG